MAARVRLHYCIRDEPGIVPHIYASEKANPAMFEADGCGLQAVTLAWLFRNKVAQQGAFYFMHRPGIMNFVRVLSVEACDISPTYPVRLQGWPVRQLAPGTIFFVERKHCEEYL